MLDHLAAFAAISLYFISTLFLVLRLRQHQRFISSGRLFLLVPGFLAVLAHAASLHNTMLIESGVNFGFYSALSLVCLVMALFSLIATLRHPVEIMASFFMPLAIISIVLDGMESTVHLLPNENISGLLAHILTSIIAYSLLGLAALHAVILSFQNRLLHEHNTTGLIKLLPPLKTMETILFEIILVGFICLSFSLISGLIFLEDMFAQHLAHKTILSILAWLVFGILLAGHWVFGWRGKKAVHWTLGGFASLMLAYFGSKFVLEIILA